MKHFLVCTLLAVGCAATVDVEEHVSVSDEELIARGSSVLVVPNNSTVDAYDNVTTEDGEPWFGKRVAARGAAFVRSFGGWMDFAVQDQAVYPSTTSIQLTQANIIVPAAPIIQEGQTLGFFPGLESSIGGGSCGVIQPVLAWGTSNAGGGKFWSISAWWQRDGGQTVTPAVRVNVGDQIYAYVKMIRKSNNTFVYHVGIIDQTNTTLQRAIDVSTGLCIWNQSFPMVFEAPCSRIAGTSQCVDTATNGLNKCNQMPKSISFTNIYINGSVYPDPPVAIPWNALIKVFDPLGCQAQMSSSRIDSTNHTINLRMTL